MRASLCLLLANAVGTAVADYADEDTNFRRLMAGAGRGGRGGRGGGGADANDLDICANPRAVGHMNADMNGGQRGITEVMAPTGTVHDDSTDEQIDCTQVRKTP
jgi:hypothetical protein